MLYNVTLRTVRATAVAVEKKYVTYSECVFVALFMQHANRMLRIISSYAACLATLYFSTLLHKRHDFRGKKIIKHKICVMISSTNFFENFLIVRIIEPDIIINVQGSSCKVPLILVIF
jgi:hypothetical protein